MSELKAAHGSMNRPRVVIAEDFVLIQEMIRALLEPECEVVAAVEDGPAALNAVAAHRPDILLVDVSLPGANGFVVTERVRQNDPSVKIVFVSAHRDQDYVEKAFEMGASGYVLKGSIRVDLRAAITEVVGGRLYRSPSLA